MFKKNRLYNSMKNFESFKRKNQSIFYDICLKIIKKSNDNLPNKNEYINQITTLKTNYLNKTKRRKKLSERKYPFQKTILLSHRKI